MKRRAVLIGLAAAGLVTTTSLPAYAQLDDFLCSTFSYKCQEPPPPSTPALAPEAAPAPEPTKHARKMHKKKVAKAKVEKTESAAPPPAAPESAPK